MDLGWWSSLQRRYTASVGKRPTFPQRYNCLPSPNWSQGGQKLTDWKRVRTWSFLLVPLFPNLHPSLLPPQLGKQFSYPKGQVWAGGRERWKGVKQQQGVGSPCLPGPAVFWLCALCSWLSPVAICSGVFGDLLWWGSYTIQAFNQMNIIFIKPGTLFLPQP